MNILPRKKITPLVRQPRDKKPTAQTIHIPPNIGEKTRRVGMAMSVEDMAEELSIGRNVAYQLIKQPGFPSFMIGRRVLVNRKGLQEWIETQCQKGLIIIPPE